MNGEGLSNILMNFKFLIGEWINSSRDDTHLIFIESKILDAIGIIHDILCFIDELSEIEMLVL